jgi:hypothetical protein
VTMTFTCSQSGKKYAVAVIVVVFSIVIVVAILGLQISYILIYNSGLISGDLSSLFCSVPWFQQVFSLYVPKGRSEYKDEGLPSLSSISKSRSTAQIVHQIHHVVLQ